MNPRVGAVKQLKHGWIARVTFTDPVTGKRKDLRRKASTKAEAVKQRDRMLREIDGSEGKSLAHDRKTFRDFADHYQAEYLQPARYVEGRKVSGLRSWYTPRLHLKMLVEHFGGTRLRSITYSELKVLRQKRLGTVTKDGRQRTIATVNRELSLLNRMFTVAVREGWLLRNPFQLGEPLISMADEKHRERIITAEEERALLAACEHPQRRHLCPILICALDTGMRRSEMLKLRWADVDFDESILTIRAFNTKTMRSREVAMTGRLANELRILALASGRDPEGLVFGISNNIKRSFDSARRAAGISDLRLHDLRHTAATRLVEGGFELTQTGRILGHTQPKTTYRYVNASRTTAQRAAKILDEFCG